MSRIARDLRAETPGLHDDVYLNFGAHGPSPRSVVEAADEFLRTHEYEIDTQHDPYEMAFDTYERVRERVSDFVVADTDEVALMESTTAGINAIATAIDWQPGDAVVRTDLEHPAGMLPWQRLEREGVEVRVVETEAGRVDTEAFADAVADARLACFSAVTWTRGTRLPVADLVEITHESGALALVDAVQVPGQLPLDVTKWNADVVAAAGHKWLMGLWGGGFLYVDRDVAETLQPTAVGYRSVEEPNADHFEYAAGARRFEIGSANPASHVALKEAINRIEDVGIERIEDQIHTLAGRMTDGVPADRLLSPATPESGLVSIDVDDASATVERLASEGIVVRALPTSEAIRASVHAVNTKAEVDRFLEVLDP
jgi:cysteine desulfurase/selenocysteine lyase